MNKKLIKHIKLNFKAEFKADPLLVFSPGRINLIGEHTDYNKGFVFPAAIDKGIYAAIQKSNADNSTIIALDKKERHQFTTTSISVLPENSWKNYVLGVVAEIKKKGKIVPNFNFIFSGDIPLGAGLSSSAALENSVVFSLNKLFDFGFTKKEMTFISQQAEHNYAGVKCGIMDQFASLFGKENTALHLDCKTLEYKAFPIQFKDVEIILINTNVKHSLADSAYNNRRAVCEKVAALLQVNSLRDANEVMLKTMASQLSKEDYEQALYVIQENERTLLAAKAIEENNLVNFGALLFASHQGLSKQYQVSCEELDFLVTEAKKSNAVIGARMMGGGFGGCTINLIKSPEKETFLKSIKEAYNTKFKKQCSVYEVTIANGTQIISS